MSGIGTELRARSGRLLLVAGFAVTLVATSATAAGAEPIKPGGAAAGARPGVATLGAVPAGFTSWKELARVQTRLDTAADRIATAPGAASGLAGITAVAQRGELVVYWKGAMPAATADLVRSLRRQVPVQVLPARYSAAELGAVSEKLAAGPGVTSAGGKVDGSGVQVTVDADAVTAYSVDAVAAGVPVSVRTGSRPQVAGCTGRQDDCSAYWGGSKYTTPGGCSTGFAINHAGVRKILSAGHCANNGAVARDGGGEVMGTIQNDNNPRDTLMIGLSAGLSTDGRIYSGAWNAGTGSSRDVFGATGNHVGGMVCTSGSYTGEHCNIQVVATGLFINTDVGVLGPVVQAQQLNGTVAAGKGDSGGPVHFLFTEGDVNAKGTITAIDNIVACPVGSPSSLCGSTVYYVDIINALTFYGATIVS